MLDIFSPKLRSYKENKNLSRHHITMSKKNFKVNISVNGHFWTTNNSIFILCLGEVEDIKYYIQTYMQLNDFMRWLAIFCTIKERSVVHCRLSSDWGSEEHIKRIWHQSSNLCRKSKVKIGAAVDGRIENWCYWNKLKKERPPPPPLVTDEKRL